MPKIIVRRGQNASTEYKLEGEKFTLGRRKTSDIPVADPKSSRNHAEIFKQGDHYYVRDLASRNGTFLNGERLAGDTQLSFGDEVSIGDTAMEFIGDSAGKPIDLDIPGYQLLERIGEGGMGVVYRARQVSMDRIVAIKVLSEKYSSNSEFIDRFIREARAAGRLNHPNVIHVHDVSKAGGRYFFSMEFIDGPNVKKVLREKGRLPVRQSVEIVTQAAKALEFAHENGIIHRDIKPDNIMLTGEGIVKIADLGIAKSFEEGSLAPEAAGQRKVLGTPHYMAPEQALGKAIDRRADVYSLGASFYHMLTGKTPFKGSTITELLRAHVHEKLEPIQTLNAEVPEPICFIVERMMAKNPEKRYENMTRLLEDLGKAGQDHKAEIERLAPEESSIMPAAEAAKLAAARAEARARPASRPVQNLVVMLVALVVVLGVLVGVYFLVQRLRPRLRQPTPIVVPQPVLPGDVPEPERLLREAEIHLQAGREDPAMAAAGRIAANFPSSAEAGRAREIVEQIRKRQDGALQQEVNLAIAEARKVEQDSPGDHSKQIAAWQKIMMTERFNGTAAETEAKASMERIRRARDSEEGSKRRQEYDAALQKSEGLLKAEDFVEAAKVLREFSGFHGASDEGKAAEARAKEIEEAAEALIKAVDKQSEDALAAGRFVEAAGVYDVIKGRVKSAAWLGDLPARGEAVKAKVKGLFDAGLKLAVDDAKAGRLADSERKARDLEARFAGTAHAVEAERLRKGLEALPALRRKVIAAVGQGEPRRLAFKPDAPLFPGINWRVTEANADKVVLEATKDGIPLSSAMNWATMTAKDAYGLYMMYLDNPTKDEHRALTFFCEIGGLAAEADEHRKKAE